MEIKEKIENELRNALKKRDSVTVATLRMLKAAIHNKEIERKGKQLQGEEIIKVISKQVQQHQDSIEHFKKGKREDLVGKESKELEILKKYLPKQLSPKEVKEIVIKIIADTGAKDKSDFGKVMKKAMSELKCKADGKLINQIVSEYLKT